MWLHSLGCSLQWGNTALQPIRGQMMVIALGSDSKFILDTSCAHLPLAAAIEVQQQAHSVLHLCAAVEPQLRAERDSELPAALLHAGCQAAAVPLQHMFAPDQAKGRQDAACSRLTGLH